MTTNFRRIALLTGVSAAALGISNVTATAALAAPVPPVGDGTYAGDFTNDTLVEICELANNSTGPTPPCFFGVVDTAGASSAATLNNVPTGQAGYTGPATTAEIYVTGVAEFGAYAVGVNGAGDADAVAIISGGGALGMLPNNSTTLQPGAANFIYDVDGSLTINAVAAAYATGATGDATATALVDGSFFGAMFQYANVTETASLSIDNDGAIAIQALAYASAPDTASAYATVINGVRQMAYGTAADVDINNSGSLDVVALAIANGGDSANAYASVNGGIVQFADADTGPATVDLNNTAGNAITIAAIADADGGNANAYATLVGGIEQAAVASGTSATVGINNQGAVLIEAVALADGTTSIDAVANLTDAIDQVAYATTGLAAAQLVNGGSITINGLAYGTGTDGATANVNVVGNDLISQFAGVLGAPGAFAYASINNDGVIDANFTAVAHAVGATQYASLALASAQVNGFIRQGASAIFTGTATAAIINGGTISLDVNAIARGYATGGAASAIAGINGGIEQNVVGKSGATALIDNDGLISINAAAIATGGDVFANAVVNSALAQNVQAKSGDAFASILNDGTIDIGAFASVVGDAQAVAIINGAVVQNALAEEYESVGYDSAGVGALATSVGPDANVTLVNNGLVDIHATALAHDTVTGPATATAIVNGAVVQNAIATDGAAGVNISGAGTIEVLAYASAIADAGNAFAYASVVDAIDQNAISTGGGLATGFLSQGGGIDIGAVANASGVTAAYASAVILDGGIQQLVVATAPDTATAVGQIINDATINIIASADATATDYFIPSPSATAVLGLAEAFAGVEAGIWQTVVAEAVDGTFTTTIGGDVFFDYTGSAFATAQLTNTGEINVMALANADAGYASALALVGTGIWQGAFAQGGETASANVTMVNSGDINVVADANAYGTFAAGAGAGIQYGVLQFAYASAFDGSAVADISLDNDGNIVVLADAEAVATGVDVFLDPLLGPAAAGAQIFAGVVQSAQAGGSALQTIIDATPFDLLIFAQVPTATASVSLTNSGLIAVQANAYAEGSAAGAGAGIGFGVVQVASADAADDANANAYMTNAGTILVSANATAIGSGGAGAAAGIDFGVAQFAYASATKSGATAQADATLVNDGLISVNANANAVATDGGAGAAAGIGVGVIQTAYASAFFGTAVAQGDFTNNGTIAVSANAYASGAGGAGAAAAVNTGVLQLIEAYGSAGYATGNFLNEGTIFVGADAFAYGSSIGANAVIGGGVVQVVEGVDAGYGSMVNNGDIAVVAEADAVGNQPVAAGANAAIGVGVAQNVFADGDEGVATANIDNTGGILVLADAVGAYASGGSAGAAANIGTGIQQVAAAEFVADADLNNSGTIDVFALAEASADDDAGAAANIGIVIHQAAYATGDDLGYATVNASVSLINSGSIVGVADALVRGGDTVNAVGVIGEGIYQRAFAGEEGFASAFVYNTAGAYITMIGSANAVGGGDGLAVAGAEGGDQFAAGGDGAAVTAINDGSIIVAANADLLVGNAAEKGASAEAFANATGWSQGAGAFTESYVTSPLAFGDAFPAGAAVSDYLTGVTFAKSATFFDTPSGPANALFVNNGVFQVTADASAVGDDDALAEAFAGGVFQDVGGDPAYATVTNAGDMVVAAAAYASGDNGAAAFATAVGIGQAANADELSTRFSFFGTGVLHYGTGGTELAYFSASDAYETLTFTADPTGYAQAVVNNSGSLLVAASATANVNAGAGDGVTAPALAVASATGIWQEVAGATAVASVDNSGYLTVLANAVANGATAASGIANAIGISQDADAVAEVTTFRWHYQTVTNTTPLGHTSAYLTFVKTGTEVAEEFAGVANAFVDNSGSIVVGAEADVSAGSTAYAEANAFGILQTVAGTQANATVLNSGDISVVADAYASGTSAVAAAFAIGIGQSLAGTSMNAALYNTGDLNVVAIAQAYGTTGAAFAHAIGHSAAGNGGGALNVDIFNGAEIFVGAEAIAPGTAYATAQGIVLSNAPTVTVVGTATTTLGNPISGYLTNAGELNVIAVASGGTFTTPTTGGGTTTVALSAANATGIAISSGVNTMTITNTGAINVDAITENGGPATARGIYVTANGATTPGVGDLLTINNDGDIIVRQSNDGGATFLRGMAIDVATAPNNTVINLLSGNIFGNIDVQTGDEINVIVGETVFDGIINPECMPAGGPTALQLDNAAQNLCGQGDMFIGDGGTFHMVINPLEGPSYAFVDSLTFDAEGTLELDLPPADGTAPIGTYPQIFTDVATLDGTLVANIQTPGNGLWDTTVYENVIDASGTGQLATQFDQCLVTGIPATSLLLDFGCVYDNLMNVDLKLTRIAFDVPALNDNGTSVGEGLECIYDVTLTGGIADMLADLFLFTDAVNYTIALNQLSGSVYANYLQSFPSLGVHYNDILAKATDCEIPALAGSVLECRASAPIHLWGQADYQWRKADGDEEAGTSKSRRGTFVVGLDANVGAAGIIGGSIGYVTNDVRDRQFGDDVDAGGYQVGLYGVFDPGTFYVKGMGTYSWFDGDSERNINFAGLAPGATFASSPEGDPDVRMWTVGIHAGARLAMGGNSVLTPYLNWDYVNAKLKEFIETGGNGADLHIDDSRAKHSFLTAGVKWATQMGGVVPEVNLGYRHRFGDKRSKFGAAFLCQTDTPCEFDIISAAHKKGTFLAGVSVGGKMGLVDLRIGYEGEFNGDITSHAGNFKFVLPLGAKKKVAAAPAPVLAPPPPPAEAAPAPVEASPPPPPPSSGERGK